MNRTGRVLLMTALVAVVAMAFRVSWNALRDIANAIGADATAAMLYPFVVDGLMALALVATLVLVGRDRTLPLPVKDTDGKGIDLLMRLCNFANAETECLAIAWLIGCLGPSVPVAAPFLTGPQGAGKSTGGRMLTRIIEGMSGDLRRAPKDEESLIAAVAAGWVTALDNLSHVTPDLSDAMCCIVTGAESVKRALFTDGDVFRVGYRRPLLLTGIDVGVIRPDLADRLLPLRLERPSVRRTEAELWAEYAEVLPVVLGSLLDLTVKVRAVKAETPTDLRMADFAHLCAQLDAATGLGALTAYRASLDDLNDDVTHALTAASNKTAGQSPE